MPRVAINGGIPVTAIMLPLIAPASSPTPRPIATGIHTGKSVRLGNTALEKSEVCARLAAIIADNANTEPEDRSIPVVMITCVTPIASRPMIDTCRIISTRRWEFMRKLWSRTIQPNSSNTNPMPISTRKMLSSVGKRLRCLTGAVAGLLSVIAFIANHLLILWHRPTAGLRCCSSVDYGHTRSQLHDFFLGRVATVEGAHQVTLVHHHHPVAHAQHFRQLGGNHNHRHAFAGEKRDQAINLGLGADVDATGGLIENQQARVGHQPARQQGL